MTFDLYCTLGDQGYFSLGEAKNVATTIVSIRERSEKLWSTISPRRVNRFGWNFPNNW